MYIVVHVKVPVIYSVGAQTTNSEAVGELIQALHHRGPDILDVLVLCLEEEKEANKDLIVKIREIYPETGSKPSSGM